MQVNCKHLYYSCCIVLMACTLFSCSLEKSTAVRNYPKDTAFVFNNKVVVKDSSVTRDDKKLLAANLVNYWDDSLFAARSTRYSLSFFKPGRPVWLYTSRLEAPPVYDSANRVRTTGFMTGYLRSQGYYYSHIKDSIIRTSYQDQRRVTVVDTIYTGKQTKIDSVVYSLTTPRLQYLTDSSKKASLITPGKSPFATNLVAAELDRLVTLYRQKGFFLLTRSNLIAEADTLDQSLLNFSPDPFEQAQRISESIEKKKQNPSTIITVMRRENSDTSFQLLPDSAYFQPYVIGNIYFYPEADIKMVADAIMSDTLKTKKLTIGEYTTYYRKHLFKPMALIKPTLLRRGRLYNEDQFNRTMTNFNQLPAWNQVDYRTVLRGDSVDFYFFLSPARPQNITFGVEGSRNTGDFLSTGTLIGSAFNIIYTNRNLTKAADQLTASFSNGLEFTFDNRYPFLQTFLSSLNIVYSLPNVRLPFLSGRSRMRRYTFRFDASPSYSERNNFFRIRSLVTGFGLEWRTRTNWNLQVRLPNVELYSLDTLPLLKQAFNSNPFLRSSFNTGTIFSLQGAISKTFPGKNKITNTYFVRGAGEVSTFFYKFEGEARKQLVFNNNTSLALRAFAGLGYNFGSNPKFGNTLPFFKQFIGGGPNSMRAWGLRQIGLGSSIVGDTAVFRERYGDMQLEANVEYRFVITTLGSAKISSALFADAGNIWNVRKNPALPDAEFDISRFWHDIAIGVGTGLRFDFNYFLVRLDFGVKWKDPARRENGGWLDFNHFTWKDKEYGRGINNYAVQLGIGLPF